MNNASRKVKEQQKSILKRYTVDAPRFEHERTYDLSGKTRGNQFILNTARYGNWHTKGDPKGQDIVNLGSWIEDPRKGSKIPSRHDMDIKRSKQRRDQYIGPYSATGTGADYRSISSIPMQKYKGPRGRKMIFKRGAMLPETVFSPTKRVEEMNSRVHNMDMEDDNWDRKNIDKTIEKGRDYQDAGDLKHEIKYDERVGNFAQNDQGKKIIQSREHYRGESISDKRELNNEYLITPNTLLRETTLSNQKYLAPGIYDNIKKLNYNDFTTGNKSSATYNHLSNLILWNKAIEKYHKEKTPLIKSRFLTDVQKNMVREMLRSGRTEKEVVHDITKVNNAVVKKISNYDHKRDGNKTLKDITIDVLNKVLPQKKVQDIHNIIFDQKIEIERVGLLKKNQLNSKVKMVREILSSGDEMIYEDIDKSRIEFGGVNAPLRELRDGFAPPEESKKYYKTIDFMSGNAKGGTYEMDKRYDNNDRVMGGKSRGYGTPSNNLIFES